MSHLGDHDVLLLGGGLAGLCMGVQLLRARPELRVCVVEKATFPMPLAAHKVGESAVEIASLYFGDVLGLREILDATHLPKLGLRFFYSHGQNDDLASRPELGLRSFMPVRTWQMDRGLLENQLAALFQRLGGVLHDGVKVTGVDLGDPLHRVHLGTDTGTSLTCRWVLDASGRASVLKKKLRLARRVRHQVNASWWRVPGAVDVDTWSENAAFQAWTTEPRRLSTMHLLGPSYWVWLIPLSSGGTSVGIVAEDSRHAFSTLRTPEAADAWLRTHEPQAALQLGKAGARQDFAAIKHFSYSATQLLSEDRWALIGDAGVFADPFYSPGSDFIAMSNTLVGDAVLAELEGRSDTSERIETWNRQLLYLYRAFLTLYQGRYPMMGRPGPLNSKIAWDFTAYWAVHATLFASGKMADLGVAKELAPLFQKLLQLNLQVQSLLSRWGRVASDVGTPGARYDYGASGVLRGLNESLLTASSVDIVERVTENYALLEKASAELSQHVVQCAPGVEPLDLEFTGSTGVFDTVWKH